MRGRRRGEEREQGEERTVKEIRDERGKTENEESTTTHMRFKRKKDPKKKKKRKEGRRNEGRGNKEMIRCHPKDKGKR